MDKFDEIYVISDIHLGGRNDQDDNFQIFKYGDRLGRFIDHVASVRSDERVALILNGDVFDSLAEDDVPGYVAIDESEAKRFMERIYADVSFQPIWRSLEAFLHTPNRHLIHRESAARFSQLRTRGQ